LTLGLKQTIEDLLVGVLKNAPGLQKLVDAETDKVIAKLGEVVEKEKLGSPFAPHYLPLHCTD